MTTFKLGTREDSLSMKGEGVPLWIRYYPRNHKPLHISRCTWRKGRFRCRLVLGILGRGEFCEATAQNTMSHLTGHGAYSRGHRYRSWRLLRTYSWWKVEGANAAHLTSTTMGHWGLHVSWNGAWRLDKFSQSRLSCASFWNSNLMRGILDIFGDAYIFILGQLSFISHFNQIPN